MNVASDVGRLGALFAGGGEVGRLILTHDWRTSPIGEPGSWPDALLNTVSLMLPAGAEIVVFWGPDNVAIYNDAYASAIGDKHPRALGRPARETWSHMWDDIRPMLAHVRATGKTYSAQDRRFLIERHGAREEVFFDVSYSAIRLADGTIDGVFCIVSETTARVRAARALAQDRARLAQMFDQAPGFMVVLRQPGHVVELTNASYQQLVGNRELIGRPLIEALPELASQGYIALLD